MVCLGAPRARLESEDVQRPSGPFGGEHVNDSPLSTPICTPQEKIEAIRCQTDLTSFVRTIKSSAYEGSATFRQGVGMPGVWTHCATQSSNYPGHSRVR
jgi:hypothetical protein